MFDVYGKIRQLIDATHETGPLPKLSVADQELRERILLGGVLAIATTAVTAALVQSGIGLSFALIPVIALLYFFMVAGRSVPRAARRTVIFGCLILLAGGVYLGFRLANSQWWMVSAPGAIYAMWLMIEAAKQLRNEIHTESPRA